MTSSARIERRMSTWLPGCPEWAIRCPHGEARLTSALDAPPMDEQEKWRIVTDRWRDYYRCGCTVPAQLRDAHGFGEGGAG